MSSNLHHSPDPPLRGGAEAAPGRSNEREQDQDASATEGDRAGPDAGPDAPAQAG